jgi:prolipoprotein diacylglyceryltransferase
MALVVLGLTFAGWANWANGEVRTRSEETSYANLV